MRLSVQVQKKSCEKLRLMWFNVGGGNGGGVVAVVTDAARYCALSHEILVSQFNLIRLNEMCSAQPTTPCTPTPLQ